MKDTEIEKLEILDTSLETISNMSSPIPLKRNETFSKDLDPTIEQNISFEGNRCKQEFGSGFDAEHPYPTFEQLCDVGFRSDVALSISEEYRNSYSISPHPYTKRELYRVLYESDDPVKAYNEMMEEKFREKMDKFDQTLDDVIYKYL